MLAGEGPLTELALLVWIIRALFVCPTSRHDSILDEALLNEDGVVKNDLGRREGGVESESNY